jgi:hypothetical protein
MLSPQALPNLKLLLSVTSVTILCVLPPTNPLTPQQASP